jgi:hypothetical protein
MSRRRWVLGAIGMLIAGAVSLVVWTRGGSDQSATARTGVPNVVAPIDSAARAPEGVRVRVQVLNGTSRTGLARRATQLLRDHGYDVVDYNSRGDTTQLTEVQVTAASRAWGERVVKALGRGQVREREGTLGYVDLVVLLGHDWQPSPQPLRP